MTENSFFPIVGIGASAGGVEALEILFRALPADSGMAFVVVTHLGPGRESALPAILGNTTRMPVVTVRDGEAPEADHVYVLASHAVLTLEDRHLRVRAPNSSTGRERQPIDVFLASLAEARGERAAAIVLSGGGSDGTLGIKAVKDRGGLTLAQGTDGTAPRHPSMPESAAATGAVDLLVPVEDMPARLAEFARGLSALDGIVADDRPPTVAERATAARGAICAVLRGQVGHDFSGYKEKTFFRRVGRRMQVLQLGEIDAYVDHLRRHPDEVVTLFRDLLIGVTSFFRDADAFAALADKVVPAIFEGRGAEDSIRVWVPGCTTGEEAYSIAILLREHMDTLRNVPQVKVFATDIDEPALGVARAGRYPASLVADMTPERLDRFFTADGPAYAVSNELRDLCVFSSHSVIRDPPFSRIDLISCRNLLIYLDGGLQERVIPVFHYALRPGGFLFLGLSENITRHADLFAAEDKARRIFRRRDVPLATGLPLYVSTASSLGNRRPWPEARPYRPTLERGPGFRQGIDALVLNEIAPAHVVVDVDGDVVHQSARLGKYLEPAVGAPTRNLLAMTRRGLRLELRAALGEALETRRRSRRHRATVEIDESGAQPVEISVMPCCEGEAESLFLVTFTDVGSPMALPGPGSDGAGLRDEAAVAQLERELRDARERLQSMIEEYETAVEELKSSNEEMVSVNEELQSTNEELETSKEEQQSVNEELQTVNIELGDKVEQLDRANADLRNLFNSTQIATVFLDRHLVIRSFTPAVSSIFPLIPSDRGRPLTDLTGRLEGIDLRRDIKAVLDGRDMVERRATTQGNATHYLVRLLPYRTEAGVVDGVLATFIDIGSLVESESLRTMVDELNHRVRNMLQVVSAIVNHTLKRAPSPEEFGMTLRGRLNALARAHELVARGNWTRVPLRDLIEKELTPYALGTGSMTLEGPPVLLRPGRALALGMAVHELATNAAKYGALSAEGGRVAVAWSIERAGGGAQLSIRWRESGGPPVEPPQRRGFGTELIERQLRHDLRGSAEVEFDEAGVCAVLVIPLDADERAEPATAAEKAGSA